MRKIINQYKKEGEWKIQLTAEINFISLKSGSDETRIIYTRSDNEEFMNGDDTNEIMFCIMILMKRAYIEVDHT